MEVKANRFIRLWDYSNKEILEYRLVEQTRKTHYIGGNVGYGGYYMKSEQVLAAGGDGVAAISVESKIGGAVVGLKLGDIAEYTSDDGNKERFRIVGISIDGKDWKEIDVNDPSFDEPLPANNLQNEYETKRIAAIGKINEQCQTKNDSRLFEQLRELRKEIAREEHLPAYMIFHDRALLEMCENLPVNNSQLLGLNGVGEAKCIKYGDRFLDIIRNFIDTEDYTNSVQNVESKVKQCFNCHYSTEESRYNFCPICGKRLESRSHKSTRKSVKTV